MKKHLLVILTFIGCSCYAQQEYSYYVFQEKQNILKRIKKYEENSMYVEGARLYDSVIILGNLTEYESLGASIAYTKTNQFSKAFDVLESIRLKKYSIFCGYDTSVFCFLDEIINEEELDPLMNNPRWELIIENLKNKQEDCYNRLNHKLSKELKDMEQLDQKDRMYVVDNWHNLAKQEKDSLFAIIDYTDSINFSRLKEIVQKYGWPGYSIAGPFAETIILHMNKDYDFYLPYLTKAANNKELDWDNVEHFLRNKLSNSKCNKLDSLFFENSKSNLHPKSKYELRRLAYTLKKYKKSYSHAIFKIIYTGNLKEKEAISLSKKRIGEIFSYLVKNGIQDGYVSYEIEIRPFAKNINKDYEIYFDFVKKE